MKTQNNSTLCLWALISLAINLALFSSSCRAQFLFTYEINQEDDSRAPKSSLFDPSAFKIVTPSQLQSSYQKISSQLDSQVATASSAPIGGGGPAAPTPQSVSAPAPVAAGEQAVAAHHHLLPASPRQEQSPGGANSLLKQTSAALQSFAELFSFGGPQSGSSPAPLANLPQPSQPAPIDQQAEARSLHEHWTQQQQQQHQQQAAASPALQSFTTSQPTSSLLQQQPTQPSADSQAPQASYWLTANPLNSPDGNYLVEIKQPHQPESAQSPSSLVDSLLALGHRNAAPQPQPQTAPVQQQASAPVRQPTGAGRQHSAQSSFLSTPTSYYPASLGESFGQNRASQAPARSAPAALREIPETAQLQPPANAPQNFVPSQHHQHHHSNSLHHHSARSQPQVASAHLKSAEESLIAFRQQQQQQPQFPVQRAPPQQVYAEPATRAQTPAPYAPTPTAAPTPSQPLGEIPKVSPQIYESFLLQQRDQHEKHMELLKQQQELNKLLEQKQKQEAASSAAEQRRRKKKEEAEREMRKKLAREQEAARKLKLEQEERRKREEEERKRQVEEARRYREYLEARERQERIEREKREREAAEQQRRREIEERELKLRMERELAERRRLEAERAEAEEAERKRKRQEEEEAAEKSAKYASYLRQQEELRKLLELKQKEDEAQQQRRRQAAREQQLQLQQQQQQQQAPQVQAPQRSIASQTNRANRLAQEHRERTQSASTRSSNWGAPLRTRGQAALGVTQAPAPVTTEPAPYSPPVHTPAAETRRPASTVQPQVQPTSAAPRESRSRSQQVAAANRRLRTQGDEKLIRQKIPLYSGAGKYGLYRNESLSQDLAALLASVTLPPAPSSSTSDASETSSTRAPEESVSPDSGSPSTGDRVASGLVSSTPSNFALDTTSSLSPLLGANGNSNSEPLFDDDVPRRPARGLTSAQLTRLQPAASSASTSSPTSTSTTSASTSTTATATPATAARPSQPSQAGPRLRLGAARAAANESASSPARSTAHIGLASLPPDADNDGIPGRAGVEYPVLSAVPPTSFSCSKQPLNGYYADTETACQVVHLCQGGVQSSILCPNGTIFNQEKFSCQWWYEVNCSRAPIFYQLNDNLYKASDLDKAGVDSPLAPPTSPISSERPKRTRVNAISIQKDKPNRSNLLSASS